MRVLLRQGRPVPGQVVADPLRLVGQADRARGPTRCRTTSSSGPGHASRAVVRRAADGLSHRRHALAGRVHARRQRDDHDQRLGACWTSRATPIRWVGRRSRWVTDAVPDRAHGRLGLPGPGWTCSGTRTRTCTRTDTLAPHASYPPITIAVTDGDPTRPGVRVQRAQVHRPRPEHGRTSTPHPIFGRRARPQGDVGGSVPGDAGADDGPAGGDVQRVHERELGAAARGVDGGHVPAVDLGHLADDRQAEAGAGPPASARAA